MHHRTLHRILCNKDLANKEGPHLHHTHLHTNPPRIGVLLRCRPCTSQASKAIRGNPPTAHLPRVVVRDRGNPPMAPLPISGKVRRVVVRDKGSPPMAPLPISGKVNRVVALREVLQGSLSLGKPLRVILRRVVVSRADPPKGAHSLGKALRVGLRDTRGNRDIKDSKDNRVIKDSRDFRGSRDRDPPLAVTRLSLSSLTAATRISKFFLRTALIVLTEELMVI